MDRANHNESLAGVEIHGMTRSAFILRGALAAGAAYGSTAAGPFVARALAQSGGGDTAIVNFALTLEYVEAAFYKAALADAKLTGAVKSLATQIGANEQAHVEALSQLVNQSGGSAAKAPKTSFPVRNEASFLRLAATFEETGVSAYNGAMPGLKSADLLTALGSIAQTEARHAAAIHDAAGQDPSPAAFDKTLTSAQVQSRVQPYITG
ncbi:MAG: ferritin-like domain-containing protein [Thermoleophilaceae bacterium]